MNDRTEPNIVIAEFITPQNPRWTGILQDVPHDFYHMPEYLEFSALHEGGTPVAFYAENEGTRFLAPLLLRELPARLQAPGAWRDAIAPYGYPTPIVVSETNASPLHGFLTAFRAAAIDSQIVTAFFRLHPLLPLTNEELLDTGTLVQHGQTVYIDLALPYNELQAQIRSGYKYDIRKLVQAGFHPVMDDWKYFEDFCALYLSTMDRVESSDYYKFSFRYFDDLRKALGPRLHLCVILSPEGDVAAGALFTTTRGIVQYHLAGTSEPYLKRAPSKLMLDFVSGWAKQHGNHLLHLGGGRGAKEDSLFQFKAGFSKLRSNFYTYRMVTDPQKNEVLKSRWQDVCGKAEDSDFFPIYRRPCP